ncbi:hypothetical protein AVEN_234481-1 [Araneus ventricosus]|uniref:Uncharacterized protein n=1 Tax=Araneus ventricosus TaxID=182803 RepID=A0A4Y2AA29_ARAVE|nr:hypothetical protein AVEN_234481-1 [Araneus ventricosus]
MFHNIFDTVPERPVGNTDNLYFILDGGSLIHRVVWPKQETFATDDADVHIVKTAIETYGEIKKQIVVIGQDVDLLVLPAALTPDYMDILMLKEGKAGSSPLVVYMGVNDLFTTSIPKWMGSNIVLVMFALSEMSDGSVDAQLLCLNSTDMADKSIQVNEELVFQILEDGFEVEDAAMKSQIPEQANGFNNIILREHQQLELMASNRTVPLKQAT